MAVYRIYLVHDDGRLQPDESYYCKTDAEAVARLKTPGSADVRNELWQGGRLVAVAFRSRPRNIDATTAAARL